LPRATSIVVEMPGARVAVHPEDVALSGSMVNLAVLPAVTTADVAGPPALTLSVPDPGMPFVIEGFDRSGQAVRATARVSRVATLLLMGAPAMTASGCAGATAIADREAFGIVTACDEGELPRVVPFAAIADWIARRVPGGLTLRGTAVLTGFELNQRELPGPLLTVSCGETRTGEVTVPFVVRADETAIDARATLVNRQSLALGEVAVLRVDDRSVRLRFSLTAPPAAVTVPSMPCPSGQALVSVGLDIVTRAVRDN
jgi:hypothetical protein